MKFAEKFIILGARINTFTSASIFNVSRNKFWSLVPTVDFMRNLRDGVCQRHLVRDIHAHT